MGVRGLQYYLEQHCPSGADSVSLTELLKRQNFANGKPIIVVDGLTCSQILYADLEWIGGGQFKQLKERAQQFVNAFKKIGVHLVFFFDGLTEVKKRRTWVDRRMKSLEKVYYVLDATAGGKRSYYIDRSRNFLKPPGMGQLCRDVFDMMDGCEVYQSLTECDEEIAEYAKSHGAFAILAQDSDFVILDAGGALYLSMQHFDLNTMTTRHYDPAALANSLGIQMSQLPLLATFMGNDVIPFEDLKGFHNKILERSSLNSRIDFRMLVPKIAMYIHTLPRTEKDLLQKLPEIAERILGSPVRYQDILTSINSYSSSQRRDFGKEKSESSRNDQWGKLLIEARQRHVKSKFSSMIYAIMKSQAFESATIMEDYRKNDLPLFARVTLPIRRCLYGILLQEKHLHPGEEHRIEEWCMAGPHSLDGPKFVTAEVPQQQHPGLKALWSNDEAYSDMRWKLFVHSVSHRLDINKLRSLPVYLVIPTMILFFIREYLDPWEVDAMLATAANLKHYSTTRLARLPSDPLHPRGIRISGLFMQTTFIIYLLLAACGFPLSKGETAQCEFFDGKLFQTKYVAAKSGASHTELCENRTDVREHFQMARQIII